MPLYVSERERERERERVPSLTFKTAQLLWGTEGVFTFTLCSFPPSTTKSMLAKQDKFSSVPFASLAIIISVKTFALKDRTRNSLSLFLSLSHAQTHTHTCTHAPMHACTPARTHVCVHPHAQTYPCIKTLTHIHTGNTYIRARTHTCIHTRTYTKT